jgi:catechol 2,3-dioxygenase-like lactoylglutathione lyase family enzyme
MAGPGTHPVAQAEAAHATEARYVRLHTLEVVMEHQQLASPLGADVAATQILVVADPSRSRDFWVKVLGAEVYREYGGTSVVLRFAGTWLLLVSGGGPTADKPAVVFEPPHDPGRVSHAMTLRVTDCQAVYEALRSRGAAFLTPPHDWGSEIRCFLRDPDGHLVEISQSTST